MRRGLAFIAAVVALATSTAGAQRATREIRGTTRDSSSAAPLAGALIQVRGESDVRSVRSDDAGRFRFAGLSPGTYRVSALRIGYAEVTRDIRLAERDTTIEISIVALPRVLGEIRVRGDISAVFGRVGSLPDLLPVRGAKVQVIGATASADVDSSGAFFIPVDRAGTYLVRISAPGFAEQRFPVVVPNRRAVDASRLLDPSANAPHPALEFVYRDANERIRSRGNNSAIVPGSEVREGGSNLFDALQRSPEFIRRGMRFGATACVYVNGRGSALTLMGINVDDVETVEVYGRNGDVTATLVRVSTTCAPVPGSVTRRSDVAGSPEVVRSVVVWLKP